ncbi:hypothetical protein DEO72_LG6g629 [Vigna unguiculata]|uniref:Uncharacterized protein n=1 Tax=Vigna unguiculata TaxID=3917 RepID=A0A4D6M618_VIGUN|nr:hypothetical protein DEO72_LG6g629 [Vigna unguiculata]
MIIHNKTKTKRESELELPYLEMGSYRTFGTEPRSTVALEPDSQLEQWIKMSCYRVSTATAKAIQYRGENGSGNSSRKWGILFYEK